MRLCLPDPGRDYERQSGKTGYKHPQHQNGVPAKSMCEVRQLLRCRETTGVHVEKGQVAYRKIRVLPGLQDRTIDHIRHTGDMSRLRTLREGLPAISYFAQRQETAG